MQSIEIHGRRFCCFSPANLLASAPTLIILHGRTFDADRMAAYTRFNELAAREGFRVIYPDGSGRPRSWHAVINNPEGFDHDLNFLNAVLEWLERVEGADPQRFCIAGHSSGGMMTYQMICRYPLRFMGAAIVASSIGAEVDGQKLATVLPPEVPVPILLIHGKQDLIVRFEGGEGPTAPGRRFFSFSAAREFWLRANRLSASRFSNQEIGPGVEEAVFRGESDRQLLVCAVLEKGNHHWPGAAKVSGLTAVEPNLELDASQYIWDFFSHLQPVKDVDAP